MFEQQDLSTATDKRELIRCAKCDTENLVGATRCHDCGAHLYLLCQQCGRPSARSLRSCSFCGGRLGRPGWLRWRGRLFTRFSIWEALGAVVVVAILIRILVVACRGLLGPAPEEPTLPEYDKTVDQREAADPATDPQPEPK